jgi:uncharacterized membrane protein YhhN
MDVGWFLGAVALCGMLAIWFSYRQPDPGYYLFKPLTTLLILGLVIQAGSGISAYRVLIGGGLIFSILGDILLMLPADRFQTGLGAFLVTHLLYIFAFSSGLNRLFWVPGLLISALAAGAMITLDRFLGRLKLPVYLYIGVISVMAWTAWSRWMGSPGSASLLAACGAALFLFSDLVLALDRFKGRFKAARAINLASYYAAQLLIAFSAAALS